MDDRLHPGYQQRHPDQCRALWKDVPDSGACTELHAELLRSVEKLADEAQQNGNINWDRDFERFCDLLDTHVLHSHALTAEDRDMAARDLDVLRRCGRVAYDLKPEWAQDEDYPDPAVPEPLPEDAAQAATDPDTIPPVAYVHEDLYRHLADCIAVVAQAHPHPVRYTAPVDQYR